MRTGHKAGSHWSKSQQFACLSQRLALEFQRTSFTAQEYEREQMEGHTRICIRMQDNYETVDTITGSEPLLAEAAYNIMSDPEFKPAETMKLLFNSFSVHQGDRGELMSMLLLTLARDATVGPSAHNGHPASGSRLFTIPNFFEHLLRGFKDTQAQIGPKLDTDTQIIRKFNEDFHQCYMHFNHFVKVHQSAVLRPSKLLGLSSRGAAILCANNQAGVDMVLLGYGGKHAHQSNQILVLVQSKNDPRFTAKPRQEILEAMDPYKLGIWDINDHSIPRRKPVIRIVFALAVKGTNAKVTIQHKTNVYTSKSEVKGRPDHTVSYDSYDIWIAGMSDKILCPISPEENHIWEALLQGSVRWEAPFLGIDDDTAALRRAMDAGSATHPAHWLQWTTDGKETGDLFGPIQPNTQASGSGTSGSKATQAGRSGASTSATGGSKGGSKGSSKGGM